MQVPFVDLKSQLKPIRAEVERRIAGTLDRCDFILGQEVQEFEKNFAAYIGVSDCIGVANGTDALHLAVRALGIGEGDEVIVPVNTFIATALGVTFSGARPVFVDHDPETFLMDVDQVAKAVTKRTRAIIPVHLYGRAVDLGPILKLADRHGLKVIEDAAQSHGARFPGSPRTGAIGAMGCFSFYPGKNLGAYGDGGAVVTNNPELATQLRAIRNYGSPKKYEHPMIGFNCRLDTMQAAVLNAKLPHLDTYNQKRYQAAVKYAAALKGVGDLMLPHVPEAGSHVFHLYVVRTHHRDELLKHYAAQGIGAGIHYPYPLHQTGAYESLGYKRGAFPVAERAAAEILSLPMFPEITDEQIQRVAQVTRDFFSQL